MTQKEYMVCSSYRKIKGGCTSHSIKNETLEVLLFEKINAILGFISRHEKVFVRLVTKKSQEESDRSLRDGKRELDQARVRMRKLDEIIQRLYEDNLDGKISDERFAKMSANYEEEQETLDARISDLQDMISTEKTRSQGVESFLKIVRGRTSIAELTPTIIREFVDKIYVHQAFDFNGQKVQEINIHWNFIGIFDPPESDLVDGNGKSA